MSTRLKTAAYGALAICVLWFGYGFYASYARVADAPAEPPATTNAAARPDPATPDQAGSFQAIIALVLAFLGGTFFSISQVGGLLEKLSLLTPHAWFLRGLGDLQGGDVSAVLPSVAALLAFGMVAGLIAWPFLRRAVQR